MMREIAFEAGESVILRGEEAFHLAAVLRVRPGEEILLSGENGRVALAEVTEVSEKKKEAFVVLRVKEVRESRAESPVYIRVFQGLPKGKKTDLVLQKCTELGASEIVFVAMDRSVPEGRPEKTERFEKICLAAAEQCGRARRVKVSFLSGAEEAIAEMKKSDVFFACWEEEREGNLPELLSRPAKSLAFLVGPEGGISPREAALLADAGVPTVTLGPRILRTETAAPAVLSMLLLEKELRV